MGDSNIFDKLFGKKKEKNNSDTLLVKESDNLGDVTSSADNNGSTLGENPTEEKTSELNENSTLENSSALGEKPTEKNSLLGEDVSSEIENSTANNSSKDEQITPDGGNENSSLSQNQEEEKEEKEEKKHDISKVPTAPKGSKYIVDGALFQCSLDTTKLVSQIVPTNQQKVYVQNKLVLTDQDKTLSNPFGLCSGILIQGVPQACISTGQSWFSDQSFDTKKNAKLPTENSKLICTNTNTGIIGQITCLFPGQIEMASSLLLDGFGFEMKSFLNPYFVESSSYTEKKVNSEEFIVNKISAFESKVITDAKKGTQKKPVSNPLKADKEYKITVQKTANLQFIATIKDNKKGKFYPVNWALCQLDNGKIVSCNIYPNFGEVLSIVMRFPGTYFVEGMGNWKNFNTRSLYENLAKLLDKQGPVDNIKEVVEQKLLEIEESMDDTNKNNKTTSSQTKTVANNPNAPYLVSNGKCKLIIQVEENSITGITSQNSKVNSNVYYVKQGTSAIIKPQFKYKFDNTLYEVSYKITENDGHEVVSFDHSFNTGSLEFKLIPKNANEICTITFYLHKIGEEASICSKTFSFRSYREVYMNCSVVKKVTGDTSDEMNVSLRRPHETLKFEIFEEVGTATKTIKKIEKPVNWKVTNLDTGIVDLQSFTASSSIEYITGSPGTYKVEADLSEIMYFNGGVRGDSVDYKEKASQLSFKIEHILVVSNNNVTNVSITTNPLYVGLKYPVDIAYLFGSKGVTKLDEQNTKLKVDGVEVEKNKISVEKAGKHQIIAYSYEQEPVSTEYEFIDPTIKKWEFCDSDGKYLEYVGFKMPFYIHINIPAWGQYQSDDSPLNKVRLSLWIHSKSVGSNSIKNGVLGRGSFLENKFTPISVDELNKEIEIDKNGDIKVEFTKNSKLWEILDKEKSYFEESVDLLFTIDDRKNTIVCPVIGMERKFKLNNTLWGGVHGRYLHITNKKCISGYFSDASGNKLLNVQTYESSVYAFIRFLNFSENEITNMDFVLVENLKDKDAKISKQKLPKPDNGVVKLQIDVSSLKPQNEEAIKVRLFYFEILNSVKNYTYPSNNFEVQDYDSSTLKEKSKDKSQKKYVGSYLYQLKLSESVDAKLKSTIATIAPVVVGEEISIEKNDFVNTKCFCNRDFTVGEVKAILKKLKGDKWSGNLWSKTPNLDDKSLESFTNELNWGFRKYGINKCIQKITFLAIAATETGRFEKSEEGKSSFNSSKSKYKGRGLLHLTGELNKDTKMYDKPGVYRSYNLRVHKPDTNFVEKPELIAENLHYLIDSSCYYFAKYKTIPNFAIAGDANERDAQKKKQEMWAKALGKTLNDTSILIETENNEDYYYLINKVLNGYQLKEIKEAPNSWEDRQDNFKSLKDAFGYDPTICKEVELFYYPHEWHDPLDKMSSCFFSQFGHPKPYNSIFCRRSGSDHNGVDLFAKIGDPVYACLTGTILTISDESPSGGKVIWIKVTDPRQLFVFNQRKRDYQRIFVKEKHSEDGDKASYAERNNDGGFNTNNGIVFAYMHLDKIVENLSTGDYVSVGQVIGWAGRTGKDAKNTQGPHLHFEICAYEPSNPCDFKNKRANPAYNLYFKMYRKSYDDKNKKDIIIVYDCDSCEDRSKCHSCEGREINYPQNPFEETYADSTLEEQRKTRLEMRDLNNKLGLKNYPE